MKMYGGIGFFITRKRIERWYQHGQKLERYCCLDYHEEIIHWFTKWSIYRQCLFSS